MELLYEQSNGSIYDLYNNRVVNYKCSNIIKRGQVCKLTDYFWFRFTPYSLDYTYNGVECRIPFSKDYNSNERTTSLDFNYVLKLDDYAYFIYSMEFGILVYNRKPLFIIDYLNNVCIKSFSIRANIVLLNWYKNLLNTSSDINDMRTVLSIF